jgi:hypothetical protein
MRTKTLKWALGVGVALATAVILVRTVAQFRSDPSKEEEEEKKEEAIKPPSRVSIQNGQAVITLDAETQSRVGIAIAPLKPITARGQVTAPAVVLSAQELVSLRNSYVAALAALEKARANTDVALQQYDRLKALYQDNQNASQKDLQAAQGILRSSQADLQTAQQDLALQAAAARQSWGDVVAKWIVDDPPPLDRVLDQRDFLVQVTLPRDQVSTAPQTISLEIPGSHHTQALLVSTFPRIDSRIQGLSFLYVTQNHLTLAPGLNLVARLAVGVPRRGVLVPRSAVVWWQGRAWVYQQVAPGHFVRRQVPTETPLEKGVFVSTGLAAGNQIVMRGAQTLLSEEFRTQLQAEE